MLVQIGRGKCEPSTVTLNDTGFLVEFYRYKDSIADDIMSADLVISHAGIHCLYTASFFFDADVSSLSIAKFSY